MVALLDHWDQPAYLSRSPFVSRHVGACQVVYGWILPTSTKQGNQPVFTRIRIFLFLVFLGVSTPSYQMFGDPRGHRRSYSFPQNFSKVIIWHQSHLQNIKWSNLQSKLAKHAQWKIKTVITGWKKYIYMFFTWSLWCLLECRIWTIFEQYTAVVLEIEALLPWCVETNEARTEIV